MIEQQRFSRVLAPQPAAAATVSTGAVSSKSFDCLTFLASFGATVDAAVNLQGSNDDGATWSTLKTDAIVADEMYVVEVTQAAHAWRDYRLQVVPASATDVESVVAIHSKSTDAHLPLVSADCFVEEIVHAPEAIA